MPVFVCGLTVNDRRCIRLGANAIGTVTADIQTITLSLEMNVMIHFRWSIAGLSNT